jgi:hypothetical protein
MFLRLGAVALAAGLVGFANDWPSNLIGFSTAQPYGLQMLVLAVAVIGIGIVALAVAFAVGLVHGSAEPRPVSSANVFLPSLALGALVAGLAALSRRLGPSHLPPWADFSGAGDWMPVVGTAVADLMGFVTSTALFLLMFAAVDELTRRWSRRRGLFVAVFLVLGLVLSGTGDVEGLPGWLAAGLVQGLILLAAYVLVLRHDLTLVPPALAVTIVLGSVRDGLSEAYPGAVVGHAVGIVLVGLLAVYWTRAFRPSSPGPVTPEPTPS